MRRPQQSAPPAVTRQFLLAGAVAATLTVAVSLVLLGLRAVPTATRPEPVAISDSSISLWARVADRLMDEVPAPLLLGADGQDPLLTDVLAESGVTPARFQEIASAVKVASASATQESTAAVAADLLARTELPVEIRFTAPLILSRPSPALATARDLQWELLNSLARHQNQSLGDDR